MHCGVPSLISIGYRLINQIGEQGLIEVLSIGMQVQGLIVTDLTFGEFFSGKHPTTNRLQVFAVPVFLKGSGIILGFGFAGSIDVLLNVGGLFP